MRDGGGRVVVALEEPAAAGPRSGTSLPLVQHELVGAALMRPSRTTNTCTPAIVSSRKRPTTSASTVAREHRLLPVGRGRRSPRGGALMRAARSKSRSAAALAHLLGQLADELAAVDPTRKLLDALDVDARYSSGVMHAAARAGAEAHVRVEARARVAVRSRPRAGRLSRRRLSALANRRTTCAHSGTTLRRAMSTMSRAARVSV